MPVPLLELVRYLDDYLRVAQVRDDPRALNGLQLDAGGATVRRIAAAVDVCGATIDLAAEGAADLLLVHHGLYWSGLQPLTGPHGTRVRGLLAAGVSLYSAHLPLDVHADVGNNAVLARDLGLTAIEPFGVLDEVTVGVAGRFTGTRTQLVERLHQRLGVTPRLFAGGPDEVARVGLITGAGSGTLAEAAIAGLDTLVTGEAPHHRALEAEERGLNLILAGHYATETVGVQALAAHLHERFAVEWFFADHPTGL